ncbi:MAG TPA: efflux transporter outer membrane subunit [Candidatus Angelobacter sp.]|jgi:multidrug efflux system outer membrane protein|nr:efflux transporter outer membrane subunit [Candidatus Angelobacter sp.]
MRDYIRHHRIVVLILSGILTGCAVGPNYKRPANNVPAAFRQPAEDQGTINQASQTPATSLGDEKWWEVFEDKELQGLIRTALKNNYDVRIAAARVLEAQAQLGITRADQLPSVNAGGDITSQRASKSGPIPSFQTTLGQVTASAGWNLDFWGRYRRATEAARANLLASEWGQKAVMSTLVANVAADYFLLRQLDLQLEISQRTLTTRRESLQLTQTLEQHGINSLLDVRQSEQLVYTASSEIPDLQRQIVQEENALSILLGNNPGDIPRGLKLTEQPHAPEVPVGLPSTLLERRPDILQAEQNLVAANAQIGVARSAYFPQIALTGSAGYASSTLANLVSGPPIWNLAGSVVQPIFQGGRIKSGVRLAEARHEELLLSYQQTIQGALRDVSNALVAYRKNREFRIEQQHLVEAAQDAARLAEVRFKVGTTNYLEVLTNNTNYFSAELTLAQAQGNELTALVQLYQALGGGWQQ